VHQARVATRRLRSDLKTLAPVLDPVWVGHTRDELKWLGDVLGRLRDTDVLSERLNVGGSPAPSDVVGQSELRAKLDRQRQEATRGLAEVLSSERYLNLLDRLHAASTRPPFYRDMAAASEPLTAQDPAKDALPELVGASWRALRRKARRAGQNPSDHDLHRIRIRAKQLRYASEAAVPVIGKPARRTAAAAERLQTVLGEHHDAVAAEAWLRQEAGHGDAPPAATFLAGRLTAQQRRQQRKTRHQWEQVWGRVDAKKRRAWLA
jgi:CHAD domain-containing protein